MAPTSALPVQRHLPRALRGRFRGRFARNRGRPHIRTNRGYTRRGRSR